MTVESFLAWKMKFDAKRLPVSERERDDEKTRKLTGRELFMKDATLNESDLTFLGGGNRRETLLFLFFLLFFTFSGNEKMNFIQIRGKDLHLNWGSFSLSLSFLSKTLLLLLKSNPAGSTQRYYISEGVGARRRGNTGKHGKVGVKRKP